MGGKPRVRRSAEEARAVILDAAETHLRARGPDGLRLKDLADEIGISHPAILHHFGSRTALVQAVMQRMTESIINAQAPKARALWTWGFIGRSWLKMPGVRCRKI